jgi:hypothetical protein
MKKTIIAISLIFGIQAASMACEGITGGFGCGGLGGSNTGAAGGGHTIGGGGAGGSSSGLHQALVTYYSQGGLIYVDVIGYGLAQCQQTVDLYLNNPNAGATVIRQCQRVL